MKPKSIKFARMTISAANHFLLNELNKIYDEGEAASITELVMEHITKWKRTDRMLKKNEPLAPAQENHLKKYLRELCTQKPVQYVLGEAWFAGMKFFVNEHVLIPRPETEELVEWVVDEIKKSGKQNVSVLDVGTGSGCIGISVKKKLASVNVTACDVSNETLMIAKKNAESNSTEINFLLSDFLDEKSWERLGAFDYVVSNPPYIPFSEGTSMSDNVTQFEPHLALFVEDNDPLVFYRAIAKFAIEKSKKIFVEVHENYARQVVNLFKSFGFDCEIKKDLQQKNRFVMATAPLSYPPSAQF